MPTQSSHDDSLQLAAKDFLLFGGDVCEARKMSSFSEKWLDLTHRWDS